MVNIIKYYQLWIVVDMPGELLHIVDKGGKHRGKYFYKCVKKMHVH